MDLCQVRILYQGQEFMPKVARSLVYFNFMYMKLIFRQKYYCTRLFISADSEDE